ncbi:MAG: GAF domain-containing protein [Actinomycetota bacterium]|nr:GAF domain-containing protein [Actinomycetota bacterium]
MAYAHPEDRDELTRLVEKQAALRRVATLVAEGAPSADVFGAVAKEVSQVMHLPIVGVFRYDGAAATMTVIADWSDRPHAFQPGTRWPLDGSSMTARVLQTGRPARVEDYADHTGTLADGARESGLNRTAGAPIIVDGRVWGVMATSSPDAPLPGHVEERLAEFTELLATAVSTSQAREDLRRLAEEQAALRRVATLVAGGAPPVEVFEALIGEVGRLLPADAAALTRYEIDDTIAEIARWTSSGGNAPVAMRAPIESGSASGLVFETRRPGRVNNYAEVPGAAGAAARELGWRSSVGAPVIVEGRLWGVMIVASKSDDPLPVDTEGRLAQFTELVATAISNTESRAELMASRARIVTASDETRRRIERDLHDGAQQRLVSLALELRAAQEVVPPEIGPLRAELSRVVDGLTSVLDELREFAQGIHPAILAEGGLGPALKTLGRRSAVPVELDVRDELRLPERVEVAAYYVVAEALANAAKYAQASLVHVDVEVRDGVLCISVRDDGVGGADSAGGSGLLGLRDRAEAIGGAMSLQSPRGGGTALQVVLPLDDQDQ